MMIVDLRQLNSRQIEPLLSEEAQHWREELRWDYRTSLELIKRFVDARSLAGVAAVEEGRAVGYAFYVIEEHKGLLGGLYVSPRHPQQEQLETAHKLLASAFETLQAIPQVERIEAQLVPFGCEFDEALAKHGFRLYRRQFMLLELNGAGGAPAEAPTGAGPTKSAAPAGGSPFMLEPWNDRHLSQCARLIQLAYADHMDGEINDQYRSEAGALKFLKNIILLPGCGQFQADASFVLRASYGQDLVGAVLTSEVAPGVGHTTQICVMPGYQGHGLGKRLILATIAALRARRFSALSLTVTSANERAVWLYRNTGFLQIKTFIAGVWRPNGRGGRASATSVSVRAEDFLIRT